MYDHRVPSTLVVAVGFVLAFPFAAPCQQALAQEARVGGEPAADGQVQAQARGLPPRAAATDYQARGQAGKLTIAAEFKGHSIPTPEATFASEDYIAVEVGIFGPPDARLTLSPSDFTLRVVNKGKGAIALQVKKAQALRTQPYTLVFNSLKDPSWEPPVKSESKGKTTIGGSGGNSGDPAPPPPKMPFDLVRAMDQKVQKATLPEGERLLPVAGLIYFSFHGKTDNVRLVQLAYSGPAGQATLDLQPE